MERILQQGLETWGLPTDAIPRLQEFPGSCWRKTGS